MFTTNEKIQNDLSYKKVCELIQKMNQSGALWLGQGQCISMSEMIRMSLLGIGIKSRLVECQLTIIDNTNDNGATLSYIGFDNMTNPGQLDTHVVVVTETEIPMLIDASITHRLPQNFSVVVEAVQNEVDNVICNSTKNNFTLIYQQKINQKVPWQVQNSILERIQTDKKIFNNIYSLKILIIIALIVSVLNASRGVYDFYQKYFNENKMVGVSANEEILNRIDQLEKRIK
jgi:hypothetical protein